MSCTLKRVPLDFNWPLRKVWRGFINPYSKLCEECPDCDGHGYSPEAQRFEDEWYGKVEFDPVAYGAKPLTLDHPKIHDLAVRNVNHDPGFFMTHEERWRECMNRREAGVDLMELMGDDDDPDKLIRPRGPLTRIENHRGPAIAREQERLFEQCFRYEWMHHLIQADVDALVAAERLMEFTHRPINQEQVEKLKAQKAAGGSDYWLDEPNGYHPTADEVNDWSIGGIGHDSINAWTCIEARCAREGVPAQCATCGGDGDRWVDVDYDDLPSLTEGLLLPETFAAIQPVDGKVSAEVLEKLCEEWKDYEPPTGDGYQLWEDCSEGSPVSRVFETLDELCTWAEDNATTFGSFTATAAEWRKMLDADFVCHREENRIYM
jgi:hypothetical protein